MNAWEQRKLGEISEKVKEKNSDNLYSIVLTNSAEFGIIPQRDFFDKDIANEKSLNGYYIVKQDDFVYNPRISNHAPVGPIKRNQLNEVGIMSPLYYVFRTHDIENSYLATYFDATYWHKFMKLNGDSGARADRFAIKDSLFIEMPIPCPIIPEQAAIGSFFQELDQLITLQQRELKLIKEGKKTLLSKMFPKDGENFPEIRFPGFTDAWEQRKLGEVADFTKGKGYSKGDIERSGAPIILYGRLYTNYGTIIDDVDTYVTMKENSVLSEGNEIIVPSSGESSEEISRASVVAKKGVILGGDLNIIRLNSKFSSVFVAITLSNGSQQKELSKRAQGKSVVHLHNSDLKEVNLFYPTLPEQIAIGSFFQELDQLITLQQRELEILKTMKSALLKAMFA